MAYSKFRRLVVVIPMAIAAVFIARAAFAQFVSPLAPTVVTATFNQPNQMVVSWTAPASTSTPIGGYYVYRNGIAVTNTSGLTFTDTVSPGIYTYTVAAYDSSGNTGPQSSPSSPVTVIVDTTPPSTPTGLTVSSMSSSSISISWSSASDNVGVTGYYVVRNNVHIATVSSTNYTDNYLSANSPYSYKIIAYDAAGNSSNASNVLDAATLPISFSISTPYNLSATAVSTGEINIAWGAVVDNLGNTPLYSISRDGSPIASTSATTYQDTGLQAGTNYWYSVLAYDSSGAASSPSMTAGTSTLPGPKPVAVAPVALPPVIAIPVATPPATVVSSTESAVVAATTTVSTASSPTAPTVANEPIFTAVVLYGSRSSLVTALQTLLITQGDLGANYATGFFGALTQKAVQQFQCAQKIICSGSPSTTGWGAVGPKTRKALNALE